MIMDKEVELVSDTALDLGTARPGPGNPLRVFAIGVGGSLVVTTGDDDTAADDLITVDASEDMEFELPSNTKRYIMASFSQGQVGIVDTSQTNN